MVGVIQTLPFKPVKIFVAALAPILFVGVNFQLGSFLDEYWTNDTPNWYKIPECVIDLCDYILNRRFNCAKELLRFSVKPVKEIVAESGIMNADLFRHLFIENEGMTAEEYRKKWAQWNRG